MADLLYFVILATAFFSLHLASGSKCYSCTYTYTGDPTVTYECVDAPENVTQGQHIIECNQYCTIQRQWDGSLEGGRGAIRSFSRGCGPSIGNECEDELNTARKNCMTSCEQDLCNSGSGYYPNDPTNPCDPDIAAATGNTGNCETSDSQDNGDNGDSQDNGDSTDTRDYYGNSASFGHVYSITSVVSLFFSLAFVLF